MTWADDALYTAYGAGHGFEPFVEGKLSLGLAKVSGRPPVRVATQKQSLRLRKERENPLYQRVLEAFWMDVLRTRHSAITKGWGG
ncbi:MAG: hypothetical protein HY674_10385 [Chloroflexi bacterium]|nr:hypothetical protein [Chloroflexota bacterium]